MAATLEPIDTSKLLPFTQEIDSIDPATKEYSICTLVTDLEEYTEMVVSFQAAGFDQEHCEFLYADNSRANKYDAYQALNKFIAQATGKYIILCHQDILLNHDNRADLEQHIQQMDKMDPNWAILANAGGSAIRKYAIRVTENDGSDFKLGEFPSQIHSADEHFILIKKSANLGLSIDLEGFHFYGTDMVQLANIRGYTCYAIEFNLLHKSNGKMDLSFFDQRKRFYQKYGRAFKSKYVQTTCTYFLLTGSSWQRRLLNISFFLWAAKKLVQIKRKLSFSRR